MRRWRWLKIVVAAVAGLFVAIQFVPYGWAHPNPAVVADAPWSSPSSEELARTACYDCHSNETDWPLHSYVAPFSWLVRRDVEAGRHELNFSDWEHDDGEADDAAEAIAEGSMPPPVHAAASRRRPLRRRGPGARRRPPGDGGEPLRGLAGPAVTRTCVQIDNPPQLASRSTACCVLGRKNRWVAPRDARTAAG